MATHALASRPASEAGGEYLAFSLGAESYALDILKVREIRAYEKPTRIAGSAGYMKGVIDLRGEIVPIVDLRMRNGLADVRYDGTTMVIILDLGNRQVGVVVDAVSDVVRIGAEDLRPVPAMGASADSHLCALAMHEGRMLIVMDVEALFAGNTLPAAAALQPA